MTGVIHRVPPPPLAPTRSGVADRVVRGGLGGCVVCHRSCWTWCGFDPPRDHFPLHPDCVDRLLELWAAMVADGEADAESEPGPLVVAPQGAYARRATPAVPRVPRAVTVVPVALPADFSPGPYWKPGHGADSPWSVLLETATGHRLCPCGHNREHGVGLLGRFRLLGETDQDRVAVVGGALIAPDGAVADSWGSVPTPGSPRWATLHRAGDWRPCGGCSALRWPGCWFGVESGRCLGCVVADEAVDPRPPLSDPADPGPAHVPDRFLVKTARPKRRR